MALLSWGDTEASLLQAGCRAVGSLHMHSGYTAASLQRLGQGLPNWLRLSLE